MKFREDPHEATSTTETPFICEHHILWSISYSVPVLFFNGWKSGNPGARDDLRGLKKRFIVCALGFVGKMAVTKRMKCTERTYFREEGRDMGRISEISKVAGIDAA